MSIERTGSNAYIICTSSTRPSGPPTGTTIYETDTNIARAYNGTTWLPISPVIPHTTTVRAQPNGTTTSTTYVAPSTAVQISSYTKYRADTNIVFTFVGTAWESTASPSMTIGVNDGTNNNDVAFFFFNLATTHQTIVGTTSISGYAAGTYTFGCRWKVSGGTGETDTNDWWQLMVTETL